MKIKVLIIIDNLVSGGAQRQVIDLVKNIDRNQFSITICSLDQKLRDMEQELFDINVQPVFIHQQGKFNFSTLYRLYRLIRNKKFHIVHTYLFTADLYGRLAAFLAKVPVVISSVRSVDTWKKKHHIFADRLLASVNNVIISNSEAAKQFLIQQEHIARKKIRVIHNGIELERLQITRSREEIRQELSIPERAMVIALLGRNDPVKDHKIFFQMAQIVQKQIPEAIFLAMGQNITNRSIREMAYHNGIRHKTVLAEFRPDVANVLNAVDISVNCSTMEGLNNVLMESMALGVPVIATAVGGNLELVLNGKTGLLVPPASPAALAERIVYLAQNINQREQFRIEGNKFILNKFSSEKMITHTEQVYQLLVMEMFNLNN